ncbi:hypothetical protein AGLY_007680 [Aphis glycines]|uniref:Uncharacterized protein n=1 Tax=Aphis glycines TaxID=307491 RepID=A0A6G0TMS2_APHGL|nr:hypothetical protein AGLY_007680 [Aphis glycines]
MLPETPNENLPWDAELLDSAIPPIPLGIGIPIFNSQCNLQLLMIIVTYIKLFMPPWFLCLPTGHLLHFIIEVISFLNHFKQKKTKSLNHIFRVDKTCTRTRIYLREKKEIGAVIFRKLDVIITEKKARSMVGEKGGLCFNGLNTLKFKFFYTTYKKIYELHLQNNFANIQNFDKLLLIFELQMLIKKIVFGLNQKIFIDIYTKKKKNKQNRIFQMLINSITRFRKHLKFKHPHTIFPINYYDLFEGKFIKNIVLHFVILDISTKHFLIFQLQNY